MTGEELTDQQRHELEAERVPSQAELAERTLIREEANARLKRAASSKIARSEGKVPRGGEAK